jgi:hypothetical protein
MRPKEASESLTVAFDQMYYIEEGAAWSRRRGVSAMGGVGLLYGCTSCSLRYGSAMSGFTAVRAVWVDDALSDREDEVSVVAGWASKRLVRRLQNRRKEFCEALDHRSRPIAKMVVK